MQNLKSALTVSLLLLLSMPGEAKLPQLPNDIPLSVVRHRWQEKITESNHAALRPGSIYDINTYFEQNAGIARPQFNYFFYDTGLGAADPIYTIFQSGYQESWAQLIKAGLSEQNRHIDHFSVGDTPEGCRILSAYWVRHVNEFPELYNNEKAEGYTLVDISFDYYLKLRPDAQCGKHVGHEMSENFDPFKAIYPYAGRFRTFADIPPELLKHFEAKVGILKLITQEFSKTKWPRYSKVENLRDNSMWFYPEGFAPDYGINTPRIQTGLSTLQKPSQLFWPATAAMQAELPLSATLDHGNFDRLQNFWKGRPNAAFDAAKEPGHDTLDITSQVTPKNFYTSGTHIEPIQDVIGDVSDPTHFKLVSAILRPAEPESDVHFTDLQPIPQLRLVYQLMDPREPGRPLEQLFVHLMFDAVDRLAPLAVREAQRDAFLQRLDQLTLLREKGDPAEAAAATSNLLRDYTSRPVQTVSWSSSLTGIWVFGMLSRSYNEARSLEPVEIVRDGINVGYYSTAYDTVLFREAIAAGVAQKAQLQTVLDNLTPKFYRDPRRHDPEALTFHNVTCAQCHQMAARDGIHVDFNDGLDRRVKTPYRATEYLFRELDRQLRSLPRVSR